jgi:hypothetical protein
MLVKFFKNEGSKALIESKIKEYKSWFDGTFLGAEPHVSGKIKEAFKFGFKYSEKTEEEVKEEQSNKIELDKVNDYKSNLESWLDEVVRPLRNQKIIEFNWIIERDNREKALSIDTSLAGIQILEYLNYQQVLADFTKDLTYSESVQWPPKPSFI